MAEPKRPIGYPTPARRLEEAVAGVQGELSKTRTAWAEVHKMFSETLLGHMSGTAKVSADVLSASMVGALVAKLGVELSDTRIRLTELEKAIRELQTSLRT